MIPEYKYIECKWLTFQGFNSSEWEQFKKDFLPFKSLFTLDGIDEEEYAICFKFNKFVPRTEKEIPLCKKNNLYLKKEFLKALEIDMPKELYFNVGKGIVKKLR